MPRPINYRIICLLMLLLPGVTAHQVFGQRYLLDPGARPVPIQYRADKVGAYKTVGNIYYKVYLDNGNPVNSSIDSFSFGGNKYARLTLEMHVVFDKPNNRKVKDLRVIIPKDANVARRKQSWRMLWDGDRPYDIALSHDQRRTFKYIFDRNGTVNFNQPFIVAEATSVSSSWELPEIGSNRNYILSRQIKARDILTEEELFWRANKGNFSGVVAYLRKYRKGVYQRDAGRFFTSYVRRNFDELVISGKDTQGPEKFIQQFTPYKSFALVARLLAEARRVIKDRDRRVARKQPVVDDVEPRPRRRRPKAEPLPELPVVPINKKEYGYYAADNDQGVVEIKLYGFTDPAYYDIYGGLLSIDDTRLKSDSVLSIQLLKQGTVDFLIIERNNPDKYLDIPLHNLMSFKFNEDKGLSKFQFSIEGGVAPFELQLKPVDGQERVFERGNIRDREFTLTYWDLQLRNLEGRYQVVLYSDNGEDPITSTKFLIVPLSSSNAWIYPLLVAIGISLLVALLLFILNRSGRHGPSQPGRGRGRRRQHVRA